jgi:hypothetical protein
MASEGVPRLGHEQWRGMRSPMAAGARLRLVPDDPIAEIGTVAGLRRVQ